MSDQFIPIYAATAAGTLGLAGILYTKYLERRSTTTAILAEIKRLLHVLVEHDQYWDEWVRENTTDRHILVSFSLDVYDKQAANVGMFRTEYVGEIVKFYGDVRFINNLQQTRREASSTCNGAASFNETYSHALKKILQSNAKVFEKSFVKYKLSV